MFQFEVVYDDRDLQVLGKVERKRKNKEYGSSADGLLSFYSVLLGIIFLFIGSLSIMSGGAMFILLALMLIFIPPIVHSFKDTPDKKAVMGCGTKMTFKIEDGEFGYKADGGEEFNWYSWGIFSEKCYLCEGRYVFLWYDEPYGFVLPKRCMTQGDSYDFEVYLQKECGVKLKYVI